MWMKRWCALSLSGEDGWVDEEDVWVWREDGWWASTLVGPPCQLVLIEAGSSTTTTATPSQTLPTTGPATGAVTTEGFGAHNVLPLPLWRPINPIIQTTEPFWTRWQLHQETIPSETYRATHENNHIWTPWRSINIVLTDWQHKKTNIQWTKKISKTSQYISLSRWTQEALRAALDRKLGRHKQTSFDQPAGWAVAGRRRKPRRATEQYVELFVSVRWL